LDDKLTRIWAAELKQAIIDGHIEIYSVKNKELLTHLYERLHRGELIVIVAAKELNIKRVIIDDKSTRYFAESIMLKTAEILGVLLLAKDSDIIKEVKHFLDLLIEKGYRVSLKLYNQILIVAKEI
jgi:predicted nucleic acid-binding protein